MNKNIIAIMFAAAAVVSGCDKENPFVFNDGEGAVDCASMTVDYSTLTRAGEVDVKDFTVYFIDTATGAEVKNYRYAELPPIVSLPVGNYKIVADYGENPEADWEKPYYKGETGEFAVSASDVTKFDGNVSCSLSNIRVVVNIDNLCLNAVGDAKVEVKVGNSGTVLNYDSATNGKAGYFKYVEGSSSITAVLSGTLNGEPISETVAFNDAAGGKSYTVNFTANTPENNDPGEIGGDGMLTIDSSITVAESGTNVEVDKPYDDILEDDMRN